MDREYDYGFDRLMEAVRYAPHTVAGLVNAEPELLTCKNLINETVMHWFVVENDIEKVELLSACGGQVSEYALTQACSLGHVDMVYLLLGTGVIPDVNSCRIGLKLNPALPRKTVIKMRRALHRYGYILG
ncbi:hypothetical protein ACO0LM_24530 [Undibacterium sp. Di26W]|uniref:hypothetical protein n=1 Tax=Undibacterium sp. Di26W TaxID=3413035 RepID=UPI003BF44FE8